MCSCSDQEALRADPFDPSSYLLCFGTNNSFIQSCGRHQEYNAISSSCIDMPNSPRCTAIGIFPNPNSCRWYYICLWPPNGSRYQKIPVRCEPGFVYSRISRSCVSRDKLDSLNLQQNCDEEEHLLLNSDSISVVENLISDLTNNAQQIKADMTTPNSSPTVPQQVPSAIIRTPVVFAPSFSNTDTGSNNNDQAITTTESTYSCPMTVMFVLYWFPGVVNYACDVI